MAKLQSNTRIYGTANIDSTLIVGGTVYSNTGVGYITGSGGVVTQATNRTTGVTLNNPTGRITLVSQAMANTTSNTFTFTNSSISANDFLMMSHWSGGTIGNYTLNANTGAGIANVTIRSISTVTAEAPVIQYVVIKAAAS